MSTPPDRLNSKPKVAVVGKVEAWMTCGETEEEGEGVEEGRRKEINGKLSVKESRSAEVKGEGCGGSRVESHRNTLPVFSHRRVAED